MSREPKKILKEPDGPWIVDLLGGPLDGTVATCNGVEGAEERFRDDEDYSLVLPNLALWRTVRYELLTSVQYISHPELLELPDDVVVRLRDKMADQMIEAGAFPTLCYVHEDDKRLMALKITGRGIILGTPVEHDPEDDLPEKG